VYSWEPITTWPKQPAPIAGGGDERLHIGKSSAGWCFSLCVDPERGELLDRATTALDRAAGLLGDIRGRVNDAVDML